MGIALEDLETVMREWDLYKGKDPFGEKEIPILGERIIELERERGAAVDLANGTHPDHFLVPIRLVDEVARYLGEDGAVQAVELREALLSGGREFATPLLSGGREFATPAVLEPGKLEDELRKFRKDARLVDGREPPVKPHIRVEIPLQLVHELVQHLGAEETDPPKWQEEQRLREALFAAVKAPGQGLPPRAYAAAILETGQLQVIAGQLRGVLEMVETRKELLKRLAVEDLDRQAPEFSAEAVSKKAEPVIHILDERDLARCGFMGRVRPSHWPSGHVWVRERERDEFLEKRCCPECFEEAEALEASP